MNLFYKIKSKIIVLSLVSVSFLGIIVGILQVYQLHNLSNNNLVKLEKTLRLNFDNNIKAQVQTVESLVASIYQKYLDGEYTFEESKSIAADVVRDLTYGNNGYFWVDTKEGLCVVYIGSDIEGTNRYDQQDSNGKYLFHEINKNACKPDGGFTDYWFPRPGETEAVPKRSYSLYFEPYNWVIGTGNYIDDIDLIIQNKKDLYAKELQTSIVLIVMIIIGIISSIVGTRISNPISEIINAMKKISKKEIGSTVENSRTDEIGELYDSMNEINVNFKEILLKISTSSSSFIEASKQLALISLSISESSNEQSATTEEVSSSMEEIIATVQSNTDKSENTNEISSNAAKKCCKIKI